MDELNKVLDYLKGRKVITTASFREAMGYNELTAYRMMSFLMTNGYVAPDWDVYQGGYPVKKKGGNNASAN